LPRAAKLTVADDLLGIVDRYLTHTLDQDDKTHNDRYHHGDFEHKDQDTAAADGQL
jgi:hypothetical protein